MTQRIGILGGTFDPVHNAHIMLTKLAVSQAKLDFCLLLPNNIPPHRHQPTASQQQRLDMLSLATHDNPKLRVSRCEIDRPGPSYMIDTIKEIKQQYSDSSLVLILGADSYNQFECWHDWTSIIKLSELAVFTRPEHTINPNSAVEQMARQYHTPILWLNSNMEISSTEVRQHVICHDQKLADEVPKKVLEYIQAHGLYKPGTHCH